MNFFSTDKDLFTLSRIRDILIRLEDTIIFGILNRRLAPSGWRVNVFPRHTCWHKSSPAALIERAQFALNSTIYQTNAPELKDVAGDRSFFEYFLWETEKVHGELLMRRVFCIEGMDFLPLLTMFWSFLTPFSTIPLAKVRRYTRYHSHQSSHITFIIAPLLIFRTHIYRTSPDEYAFTSPLPAPIISTLDYPNFLYPNDVNVNPQILSCYLDHIVGAVAKPGDDQQYGSSATKDVEVLQALSKRIHYGTLRE